MFCFFFFFFCFFFPLMIEMITSKVHTAYFIRSQANTHKRQELEATPERDHVSTTLRTLAAASRKTHLVDRGGSACLSISACENSEKIFLCLEMQ
uniref:Putative secreted protein n=1 Tax=Rhipicephalus microplus TaxID=6941 RepID=A0A6M2DCP2_RHIMP